MCVRTLSTIQPQSEWSLTSTTTTATPTAVQRHTPRATEESPSTCPSCPHCPGRSVRVGGRTRDRPAREGGDEVHVAQAGPVAPPQERDGDSGVGHSATPTLHKHVHTNVG